MNIKKQIILLLVIFSFGKVGLAQLTIVESLPSENLVVVESKSKSPMDPTVSILFSKNGRQCLGEIVVVENNFTTVSTNNCPFRESITVGDQVSISRIKRAARQKDEDTNPGAVSLTSERSVGPGTDSTGIEIKSEGRGNQNPGGVGNPNYRKEGGHASYGITLTFIADGKMRFSDGIIQSNGRSNAIKMTQDAEQTIGIQFDYLFSRMSAWGWRGLFGIDLARDIKRVSIEASDGSKSDGTYADKPRFSVVFTEVQAVYLWNTNYFFAGLNYDFPTYKSSSDGLPLEAEGGVGGSLGFGFHLSEKFAIEFVSRVLAIDLLGASSGVRFETGLGHQSDVGIGLRHQF